MGFLNVWQLWLGLGIAGVSVPIIIHLLYRKHRKQTDWAAMELLRRAMVIRSGQVKLEDYLILLLRCLALALIALALLRPTLSKDTVSFVGQQRVGIVVAIDASFSMSHGEFSRFEKAKAKAKEILATAGEGDPVSIMLMSNVPEILLRATGYEPKRFADVLDAHKDPTPYRLSLERNIERLEELVMELKAPARECFLITDAQELDWSELSPNGRESLERLTKIASVFLVPVAIDGEENLSITRLSYASGALRRSEMARFTAQVANQGRNPTNGGIIEFYANKKLITKRLVGPVDPGKTVSVSFYHSFENDGHIQIMARLGKDELKVDNDRYAVVNVRKRINILCVDGDTSIGDEAERRGVAYAVHALRLKSRGTDSPIQVTQIEAPDLSQEQLNEFDVILMADVADVSPEMVERLHNFVSSGGGLIVFLGDRVDPELYNERFGSGEKGLLPGEFIETMEVEPDEVGWAMAKVNSDHSLASIVKRLPDGLVDSARFAKVMKVKPSTGSQVILRITEQNAPLLLSRKIGGGSVLMFTTSADRQWNNLPVHPLYTMLLQQAVTQLTSQPDARQIIVGEPAELPLKGRKVGDRVVLNSPEGKSSKEKVTQSGLRPVCEIKTDKIGIYEVAAEEDFPLVAVAANVDPAESNVRVVDAGALSSQLNPLGVQVLAQEGALSSAIESSRQGRELAYLFLIAGIIVFLLQSLLARYFTHRMGDGQSDISATLQMDKVAAARRS